MGPDGRPIKETYQTNANGGFGGGNKVVERHQMYENTGTGLKKVGHERMLNDKGRKVVRENIGGHGGAHNSYDHYKGMHEN
jgi:myeloid leukemia factor 1